MKQPPRVVATIEARMTSTRLPGKVLLPAGGMALLEVLIRRLQRAQALDQIVVATTTNEADDPVVALATDLGVSAFRGSEHDVLGRVAGALTAHRADLCVEITGDCPLVDPALVDDMVTEFQSRPELDYLSNSDPHRAVPAGLDIQVFNATALAKLAATTTDPLDREHVSYGFYRPGAERTWNAGFTDHGQAPRGTDLLVTLDYAEDYELIKAIHEELATTRPNYGIDDIIASVARHQRLHDACKQARRGLEAVL